MCDLKSKSKLEMIAIKTFSIPEPTFTTFDEQIGKWLENNPKYEIVSMKASANKFRSNLHVIYSY